MGHSLRYTLKDISVIIPTYNRPFDVQETLKSLAPFFEKLREIIIVDQSTSSETREVIAKFKSRALVYARSETPSIPIARNVGVKNAHLKSRLFCFIDDDVSVAKDYFEKIVAVFNSVPEAKGVAGYVPTPLGGIRAHLENMLKAIIHVHHLTRNSAKIISGYGNSYPSSLKKPIRSEWLPGVNMVYKKEVFSFQQFDNNLLGYTLAEDIDFSFRLFKRFPTSLIITPHARLVHRVSTTERPPTRRMSYINQVDHFYFYFKDIKRTFKNELLFVVSLIGISFLRVVNLILKPKRGEFLKALYYFDSLAYCFRNLSLIKKGKVREFKI